MVPKTWAYRHDDIFCSRPYAFDVDADNWLWEGCGANRIVGHNLQTNALRVVPLREPGSWEVYSVFAWQGKLVILVGKYPFYIVLDQATGKTVRHAIPGANPITWYGTKTPGGKLLLFERSESKVLILDDPDANARVVPCPYQGEVAFGSPGRDGLVYTTMTDPARIVRFDVKQERFVDERAIPFPEAGISGRFEHDGVLYCADSAGGRLLALELTTGKWLKPIPTPDAGKVYGYIGGGFGFEGKGYFCLSTYRHRSRLDLKTGKVIVPKGRTTVDDRPPRFLERMLVFDAASQKFDYLAAPAQADGIPLLCYNWTDGKRFVITGIVTPFVEPGVPGPEKGPWLIVQSQPAAAESGFGLYDSHWNRAEHVRQYRRSYAGHKSLFLPELPYTPPTVNMQGPATQFSPGRNAELVRRAQKTNSKTYWKYLADKLLSAAESDAAKAGLVADFVQRALYYNPIQAPQSNDPIAVLESHDARCGQGVAVSCALLDAAGIRNRSVGLNHHVVAEAFYDSAWHILDALFFGKHQPEREGRVLSVDELKAEPYLADACPQDCFVYDPELLMSEDGYQILGYCFGPWGSEPYYSYYLYAEKDHPPALATILPAQRAGDRAVRLRWTESVKFGGGKVEYAIRVCRDRDRREEIFHRRTDLTSISFDVPESNRMYFIEVKALDDHRTKNADTWYPAARSNFVLVPPEQYGWYNVI